MPCYKCGAAYLVVEQPGGVIAEIPTCTHQVITYHLSRPKVSVQQVWALLNQPRSTSE